MREGLERFEKVLLINDYLIGGGAEKVFIETIKLIKLVKPNIRVYVASCSERIPEELSTFIDKYLRLSNSKRNPLSYIFNFSNFYKIYRFLLQNEPDIIHIHNFYGSISPSVILGIKFYRKKSTKKIRVIQTLHDYSIICPNSSLYNYYTNEPCEKCIGKKVKYKIILDRCYHGNFLVSLLKFLRTYLAINVLKHTEAIDMFISPSNFLKEKLICEGIPEEKISIIRNPATNTLSDIECKKHKKEKLIIFVGRLSPEKGVDILIKGFHIAKKNTLIGNDWKLYIVGSGPEEEKLRSLSQSEDIKFIGWLEHDEVINLIRKSSLLVLPSIWYENAPNVVLEAVLNCTRVLLTNHGGMREFYYMMPDMVYLFEYNRDRNVMALNIAEALSRALNEKDTPNCEKYSSCFEPIVYINEILKEYNKL